jgi:agmatine deiminase
MFRRPAEWHRKKFIILAWPYRADLWQEDLAPAQLEFIQLVRCMNREKIVVLLPNQEEVAVFSQMLGPDAPHCTMQVIPYGDIWVRDTGPIMVQNAAGEQMAVIPNFNGWGQKYLFQEDLGLSQDIAAIFGVGAQKTSLVFEGGAVECDGLGTILTTENCLVDKFRNPGLSKAEIETELMRCLGASKVIWLSGTLKNDHTDGHIDTLARFIAPGVVAVMKPHTPEDPNAESLQKLKTELSQATDARGCALKIVEITSPGLVKDAEGQVMPASYLNFIIGNEGVYVPVYESESDQAALKTLASHMDKPVHGIKARAILTGGGAFHCMSQEFFS